MAEDKVSQNTNFDLYEIQKFQVLLSLYKPDYMYLTKQLDSILHQVGVLITLSIRLDGPDPETETFLEEYFEVNKSKYRVLSGDNIGACGSYMELLMNADSESNVVFADQDDLWSPYRLIGLSPELTNPYPILAVSSMASIDSSILEITDESVITKIPNPKFVSFENALVENVIQGARMVINPSAVKFLQDNMPDYSCLVMHDAWIYLVLSTYGKIVFSSEVSFYYRQHSSNHIGLSAAKFSNRLKRFLISRNKQRYLMAREFSLVFHNSPEVEKASLFSTLPEASLQSKFTILRCLKLQRQKRVDLVCFYFSAFLSKG
jgi:glycosyltransferase involved in cell wall biosynthesis